MTEEEIKALQEENAKLKEKVGEFESEVEKLKETIAAKDEIIEKKNQDIIGVRRKYKKLSEMTEEEKAQLSEEELKRKEEQDEIVERQEELERQQQEVLQKEREARLNKAIDKYANGDQEIATKIKANLELFRGVDKALTEEEIGGFVEKAVNLLGDEAPNPVQAAHNDLGGSAEVTGGEQSFADTPEAKELAQMMNLPVEEPAKDGGNNQ